MIVSASRRTDIPAFYSEWLVNRLRSGYALVRNPVNRGLVYRVPIAAGSTRCLVLWTKNPQALMGRLGELDRCGIPYYFLFTITAYGREIERGLADKGRLLPSFLRLSRALGAERVVWRYDPIFFTPLYTAREHLDRFRSLAGALAGSTRRCIISPLALYGKTRRNLKAVELVSMEAEHRQEFFARLREIAREAGIELCGCASPDLSAAGVPAGRCIDDALISRISGVAFRGRKDRSQRLACSCVESVDIGAYDTCLHHCLYCYANSSIDAARRNRRAHDPRSPLLYGRVEAEDRIVERGPARSPDGGPMHCPDGGPMHCPDGGPARSPDGGSGAG